MAQKIIGLEFKKSKEALFIFSTNQMLNI